MYNLIFANREGEFFDYRLRAAGRMGDRFVEIMDEDLIPLPENAGLVLIPEGRPIGINGRGEFKLLSTNPYQPGEPAFAVGATLPQGYTRTLLPAYRRTAKKPLPLLGYAAVVSKGERLYVAAVQTDELNKWEPEHYSTAALPELIEKRLAEHPQNRILRHLSRCAVQYRCFTAQNIFYARWEGGLPVSPTCNARCLGCISEQPAECCPSPQGRIDFKPTVQELVEVGACHLERAEDAIISFGQGCEGEPSLAAETIAPAVKAMRDRTPKGTINMNSNAGYTAGIKKIVQAGLNSLRVSIISANREIYDAYYRPRGYSLDNVKESIKLAKENGVFVSLNLLTMPGITDRVEETESLIRLIQETAVDMVQIRNLNIDPDYLLSKLPPGQEQEILGIPAFIQTLRRQLPGVLIGSYSKPLAGKDDRGSKL
ncbi:pyruvate-formate lyase-activating enzyme [Desulfohalotomaculum tongense]|uniref:radical SAM protein n=1 Tax=Desulforadius tongensis TaxID=1216062 RepID=UPI00195C3D7E|nr:radical SAM protein [Desulforadius tongensis]MBM7853752.1 pyruvate-formate lyase-activating enzyme [Desulforadius tongensis]